MKFSIAILTGLLVSCASAYRIDVWDKTDFQGTQRAYVCVPPSFLESSALSYLTNGKYADSHFHLKTTK